VREPVPQPAIPQEPITVLLPVKSYVPAYLREAVSSLIAQTSPRWEGVLVHARGIRADIERDLGELADDPRLTLVPERGRKLAGALNTAMRAARTEFVAILLADDLWAPDAVETLQRNIAAQPRIDFFHSARRCVDDAGEPISSVMPAAGEVTEERFRTGAPVKHLLCWRREKALAMGGMDESLNSVGPDDFDFPWSMLEAGARFAPLEECLYVYRDHRSGYRLSTHLSRRTHERETRRILRKHGVDDESIDQRLDIARASYLRQCLYSNGLDALLSRVLRRDPGGGWRENWRPPSSE
jgi:glycosyltransferase involved in cell wall biosynthesis